MALAECENPDKDGFVHERSGRNTSPYIPHLATEKHLLFHVAQFGEFDYFGHYELHAVFPFPSAGEKPL
jgi:hypothetical protein